MGGQLCNNRERTGGNFLGIGGLRLPPSNPLRLSFPGTESGIPVPKSVPGARALEGRTAVLGAPSRTHEQTGARTGPQPHSPGSSAAGASARSGLGCCSGCSPWPSSELMCWGFACLRLDMVRASGRREEPW